MLDWLHGLGLQDESVDLKLVRLVVLRIAAAFVLGCLVAGIFRVTQRRPSRQAGNMVATLILLSILMAMVTLVIGSNTARAFSLVGALAIVRFRTVVEDTRDTAFVVFAVSVGMAVGAGFVMIALVGIPFAATAAFLFRPRMEIGTAGGGQHVLTIRFGAGQRSDEPLRAVLGRHADGIKLMATATARQGAALDIVYELRLLREDNVLALVAELNALEGVQSVELKQA